MTPLHECPESIPAALRERDQWILWREVMRDGKATKMPLMATGRPASSTDPATWAPFEFVRRALPRFSGLGFVFSAADDFCGVDLDGCRDPETGKVAEWAREVIRRLDTYSEVSPSGTGVKLFCTGKAPWSGGKKRLLEGVEKMGSKQPAIEVYDRGRYFAVTGLRLGGISADAEPRQEALNWLAERYFQDDASPAGEADWHSDAAVLERARKYLARLPEAVSGQDGSGRCFRAACVLAMGFGLGRSDAMTLLREYNQVCRPPWSEKELAHKLDSAYKQNGPRNYLRLARPSHWDRVQVPEYVEAHAQLTCLAEVQPRAVSWLWPGRIPLGRITLLVGRPGDGKSMVTLDLASRVSTGSAWPDGAECGRGSVVLMTAEDDPADTIRPRLDACGADCERIHLLGGPLSLGSVDQIEGALRAVRDCRLLVVDPIGSYLGGRLDAHRDNEVRAVLAPLASLAERHGVAVLVVAHRRKSGGTTADDLALGSVGFVGLARAVWHLSRDPQDRARRLLLPGKLNLAAQCDGLALRIEGDPPRVMWEREPVAMTADDALAAEAEAQRAQPGRPAAARTGAAGWLAALLAGGPVPAAEVAERARAAGYSARTLGRAKESLGVESVREAPRGPWLWQLARQEASIPGEGEFWHSGIVKNLPGKTYVFAPPDVRMPEFQNLAM